MADPRSHGLSESTVSGIAAVLAKHANVESATLYGSRAMGTHRPNSDIDLCFFGSELNLTELLAIETELDDLLLPYKIDLSLWQNIDNPDLKAHIERVGVTFYQI